jgi:hypothetical protein
VEIREESSGLRLDVIASDIVIEVGGHLLIGGGDQPMTDDDVRELRLGNRR